MVVVVTFSFLRIIQVIGVINTGRFALVSEEIGWENYLQNGLNFYDQHTKPYSTQLINICLFVM